VSATLLLYRTAVRAARAAAPFLRGGSSKLAAGLAGRDGAAEALEAWGSNERDPARPTVWVHAPSVGEALQAGAVLAALRAGRPELQVVFTHFSPSAVGVGARIGAEVSAYLPWDLAEPCGRVLDAVRPNALIFTKTEVWPVLAGEAVRRGVPVTIVAATVPSTAGRLRWPARAVLRQTWKSLSLVCACSPEDAERLIGLGVPAACVHVTGDPAVDAAAERAAGADARSATLAPFHADRRPTLVAGSTWADDERVLQSALEDVRRRVPSLRVIVAPHEPTAAHVAELSGWLARDGWRVATLAEVEARRSAEGIDAVVVERVGVLAQLYTVADAAYVGGGFGRRGLHSVLEPAAARVPVVFGPWHEASAAARALVLSGGGLAVDERDALAEALTSWMSDPGARIQAAEQAFIYIEGHRGAARRTADLLDPLFQPRSSAWPRQ